MEKSTVNLEELDTLELVSKREYTHLINTNRKQSDFIIELENLIEKLNAENQIFKGKLIRIKQELE